MLAYEPPSRVLLGWDISPRGQIESDSEETSEWEVRFIAETAHRTRVELGHRKLDQNGDGRKSVREGVYATLTCSPSRPDSHSFARNGTYHSLALSRDPLSS